MQKSIWIGTKTPGMVHVFRPKKLWRERIKKIPKVARDLYWKPVLRKTAQRMFLPRGWDHEMTLEKAISPFDGI